MSEPSGLTHLIAAIPARTALELSISPAKLIAKVLPSNLPRTISGRAMPVARATLLRSTPLTKVGLT